MKEFVKHESTYMCDCGYEAVLIRQFQTNTYKDKKVVSSTPDPMIELAIFSQSCRCKTWREQLRWIWHIFCNKQIWADQVLLDATQMERLGKTLLSLSAEMRAAESRPTPPEGRTITEGEDICPLCYNSVSHCQCRLVE